MTDANTEYPYNPITIVSQDDETVTFTITNPFGENVIALYYQYASATTGDVKCFSETPLTSCPEPIEVTAHCLTGPKNSLAIVDIWFVDSAVVDSSDKFTVPECCEPEDDQTSISTVQYSFKVYCETKCVEPLPGGQRNLAVERGQSTSKSASDFAFSIHNEDVMEDPQPVKDNKSGQGHFCSALDYPCGENDDIMVHVCHYSAKDGYQTFCVPESDSDVIAYVPKDYCGPCIGGYGGAATYRN
jgi:hypothetical protein